MREQKNNAIEKVENIANKNQTEKEAYAAEERVRLAKLKEEQKLASKPQKKELKKEQEKTKHNIDMVYNSDKFADKNLKKNADNENGNNHGEREDKRNGRKLRGYMIATIVLSFAVSILTAALISKSVMPSQEKKELSSVYSHTFYDTVDYTDGLSLSISKLLASNDKAMIRKYLTEIKTKSALAEASFATLPLNDESKYYTVKFVNQIEGYSTSLLSKLEKQNSLDEEDRKILKELKTSVQKLSQTMQDVNAKMPNNFDFSTLGDIEKSNPLNDGFTEIDEMMQSLPQMIYDGPFSDGKEGAYEKVLEGHKLIEKEEAEEIFKNIFEDYSLQDIKYQGKTEGLFNTFNFTAETNGMQLFAQITEKGGKLLSFDYDNNCEVNNYDVDDCAEIALRFFDKLNIENLKPVWIGESDGVVTINFVCEKDGVIVYPDMIKAKVCPDTGVVVGMEASTYYLNHKTRTVETPKIEKETAMKKLSLDLKVEFSRLTIIPLENGSETLAYEFAGTIDDETYYVYVNANTGAEEQIFKVVETSKGVLLA